jgi:hypothetical protein
MVNLKYTRRVLRFVSIAAAVLVFGGSTPAVAQREGDPIPGGGPCFALILAAIYPPFPCGASTAPLPAPPIYVPFEPVGPIQPRDLDPVFDPPCCPQGTAGSSEADTIAAYLTALDDAAFDSLAGCESGGRWDFDGKYDGALQFDPGTWLANGGAQYAAYAWQATREQQIAVGRALRDTAGWAPWANCARALGLAA